MTTNYALRAVGYLASLDPGEMADSQVIAEAEQPGAAWNVGQGTITRMVTRITGIDAVTNAAGYLIHEGSDVVTNLIGAALFIGLFHLIKMRKATAVS